MVKLYRGYLKLGMGNNTTPLAELFYNKLRSKKNAWGVHLKHFSSNGISSIDDSDFRENEFNFYAKKFTKKSTITGGIDVDINAVNYYGDYFNLQLAQSDIAVPALIDQQYIQAGAYVGLENIVRTPDKIKHSTKLRFYNLQDNYDASENRLILDNTIGKSLDSITRVKMDILVDFNDYKTEPSTFSSSNTLMKLHPQFLKTSWERFYWTFGGGAYIESGDENSFRFYPTVELTLNLIDEILIPYAGFVGEVSKNSYGFLIKDNPFVSNILPIRNSSSEKIYAGIRGSFSSKISFNANVSQDKMEDAAFYVKSFGTLTGLYRSFSLEYDDVTLTMLRAELAYQDKEKIKLFLIGEYFNYEMDQSLEAWHKPEYKVTLTGQYDIRNKIVAKLDVFAIGEQQAKILEYNQSGNVLSTREASETLKGVVDANFGLEYRYTKKISAFLLISIISYQLDIKDGKIILLNVLTFWVE